MGLVHGIAALGCGCACPGQTGGSRSKWFEGVSGADRNKLHQLREIAKDNPSVRAANEKRKRANDEYHEALRVAILKQDPSLAPVLDQIRKRRAQREKSKAD
jgi:hypothetical protein